MFAVFRPAAQGQGNPGENDADAPTRLRAGASGLAGWLAGRFQSACSSQDWVGTLVRFETTDCLSHFGGRPRFLARPAASCSRHSMAAASVSRSALSFSMIVFKSTLGRLQEPGHIFVPP